MARPALAGVDGRSEIALLGLPGRTGSEQLDLEVHGASRPPTPALAPGTAALRHAFREREVPARARRRGGPPSVARAPRGRTRARPRGCRSRAGAGQRRGPAGPAQLAARCFGERYEVRSVRLPTGDQAILLPEPLECVLAHAVEQVVAGLPTGKRHGHDRLVDQGRHEPRGRRLVQPSRRRRPSTPTAMRRPGTRRAGAGAPSRRHAVGRSSTRPASRARASPPDAPRRRRACARRRSSDARISDSPRTLTRAAASSIASGSPSSRRQISATSGRRVGRELEPEPRGRARSTNRSTAADPVTASGSGSGRDDDAGLAGQPQHLATRRQHSDTGTGGENGRGHAAGLRDDMLALVQQQHGAASPSRALM